MSIGKKNTALVIGASGTVGRACVEALLNQGFWVCATARHLERLTIRHTARQERLQKLAFDITKDNIPINDAGELPNIVINCAGPAYQFSELVLTRCLAQKIPILIDVGAEPSLIDHYQQACQQKDMTVIIGAGVQPGLAGLSIRAVAQRLLGEHKSIITHIGGLQTLTPAGLADYLYAVKAGLSRPAQCWQAPQLHPISHTLAPPPSFPSTATAHASLDDESLFVAHIEELTHLESYNVIDAPELARQLQAAIGSDNPSELPSCEELNLCLFGKTPYFRIHTSGSAQHQGQQSNFQTLAYCQDSYRLTGQIAAHAACWAQAGKYPTGINWFSAIDLALQAWNELLLENKELYINWQETAAQTEIETGTL